MITPDTLKILTGFTAPALHRLAVEAGYNGPAFTMCRFLGITDCGQFCYMAVFHVKGSSDSTKVFLNYNHTMDTFFADVQLTKLA